MPSNPYKSPTNEPESERSGLLSKIVPMLQKNGTVTQTLLAYFVRGLGAISLLWLYQVIATRMPLAAAGHVYLGITVTTVLSGLSIVGLQMLSLRMIGARSLDEHRSEIAYIGQRTRWFAIPWSLACAAILFALAEPIATNIFRKPGLIPVLRWIAPSIFLSGMGLVYSHQLQGLRKFTEALITQSLGTQFLTAVILFFADEVTPESAAMSYSFASGINFALAMLFWRRTVPANEVSSVQFPDMYASCFSFWLVKAMIMSVNWAGLLIVGILVEDSTHVALFAVAQRVANLVNFLLIGVNVVVTPKFARFWREERVDRIKDLALKSTAAISFFALPIVLLLVLFPEQFLSFFKEGYEAAAPLLVILVLSQFFNVITGSVNQLLSMCEMEHELRNIVVMSGIASLLLTLVLTYARGVEGAAIACALSLLIQNIAAVFVVRQKLGFSMFGALHPQYWLSLAGLRR